MLVGVFPVGEKCLTTILDPFKFIVRIRRIKINIKCGYYRVISMHIGTICTSKIDYLHI